MFHSFVIVCAASLNQVYTEACFRLDDSWGPYKTEENCYIRSKQISDEVLFGDLNKHVFNMFVFQFGSSPPKIYVESFCEKTNDTES